MLPDPLHPAVVHLPIALAVLLPAFVLLGVVAIHARWVPARAWLVVVVLQGLLVGAGWAALETGEAQEDRVEEVVAERVIEEHEEAAERFQAMAWLALGVVAAGLLPGAAGSVGRGVALLATLAVLAAGVQVGHSGGELVYRHGAASAYIVAGGVGGSGHLSQDEDDDDSDHD